MGPDAYYLFTTPSSKLTGASVPTLQLACAVNDKGKRVVFLCQGGRLAEEAEAAGLDVCRLSPLAMAKWGRDAEAIVTSRSKDHWWAAVMWGTTKPVYRLWYNASPPGDSLWNSLLTFLTRRFFSPSLFPMGLEVGWCWLPGGVDLQTYTPGDRESGGASVIMVARMKRGRGHEKLLEALRKTELPVSVTFLGGGENLKGMEVLAFELGVSERCRFVHNRLEDYPMFLRKHRLLVYLSLGSESTARTVLEAMASGLVVLTVPQGGVPFILPPWSFSIEEERLSAILDSLVSDPLQVRKEGLFNAGWAERFSVEKSALRFLRVVADSGT